jgi:hypothetical protein
MDVSTVMAVFREVCEGTQVNGQAQAIIQIGQKASAINAKQSLSKRMGGITES